MNEIQLYGTVGQSFWGEKAFCASDVVALLANLDKPGGDLTVSLNSGGGVVDEGITIYNRLRDYPGRVTVKVEGIAASIASIIALAGDEIIMAEGAMIMVHDPAAFFVEGRGTQDDHLRTAQGLGKCATSMARIYAHRTGLDLEEVRAIMKAETYMDGEEALAKGFATAVAEGGGTPVQAAAYDYGSYRHAPAHLRAIGRRYASKISQPALVAMIAGAPAQGRSQTMAKENTTEDEDQTIEAMHEDEENTGAPGRDEAGDDGEAAGGAGSDGAETEQDGTQAEEPEDDEEEVPATASQLLKMAACFNRPAATVQHMIDRRMTATQAAAHLAQEVQGTNPMSTTTRRGLPRAQIIRDERETRRTGMTEALVAQLGRQREVTGPARGYMAMSLVEMAAQAAEYSGPLRSSMDRIRAFEAATHTTSDFPAIYENALHKRLLAVYEGAQPTFREIAEEMEFKDFREVPLVRAGDFPSLQPIGQGGEIKFGTFGESKEVAVLSSYGVQIKISRQMMINDDLGAIDRVLSGAGATVAKFEDKTFYAFALTAKMASGKNMFHADHGNLAASGSALTVASVDAGIQAMALQKGLDGDLLDVSPGIILTGPKQNLAAKQLIAEITATTATDVNPFSGEMIHVKTGRITGNEWYLLAAPSFGGSQWTYGYLDGATGPRIRTEEAFGTQGMSMSVEHDFGIGAQDYRFGYKNPGA